MTTPEMDEPGRPAAAVAGRAAYVAPTLAPFGRLTELTTAGSGPRPEYFGLSGRRQRP